jgi:hypothetical protein
MADPLLRRRALSDPDLFRLRDSEALRKLLRALHRRSLPFLAPPAASSPDRDRLGPLCVLAALARVALEENARDGYRALERGVALTPVRTLGLAWKGCAVVSGQED